MSKQVGKNGGSSPRKGASVQLDVQAIKKMKDELKVSYEEKLKVLNQTYQKQVNELSEQYQQYVDKIDAMQQGALKQHNQLVQE